MLNVKISKHLRIDNKCKRCFVREDHCFCHEVESIKNFHPVTFIVHSKELHLASNTARLAHHSLDNSYFLPRGVQNQPLDESQILLPDCENVVLFPTDEAEILDLDFVKRFPRIHLIVPDGNWDGARKVKQRVKVLRPLRAVKIAGAPQARSFMRQAPGPGFLSTIEAVAYAVGAMEGLSAQESLLRNLDRLQAIVLALRDGGQILRQLTELGRWPPALKDSEPL